MPAKSGTAALLSWCQRNTEGFKDVNVTNFHTSWRDGLAFCALIARFRPDQLDFSKRDKSKMVENLTVAFTTAEKLGIPALLDVEDFVDMERPDHFSIITYLSQFYQAWGRTTPPPRKIEAGPPAPRPVSQARPSANRNSVAKPAARGPGNTIMVTESNVCEKCKKPLEGSVMEAIGKMYHVRCFCCAGCGKNLGAQFFTVGGKPYCEACGRKAFVSARKSTTAPLADVPQKKPKEDTESKRRLEEAERLRKQKEIEEQKKREEAERLRKQKEIEEQKKREEAERLRKQKEIEEQKKREEAERLRKQKEIEEQKKKEIEEQKKREDNASGKEQQMSEYEMIRAKMAEKAKKKKEEEEERKKAAEERKSCIKMDNEEEKKKKAEMERLEEERKRKAEEEAEKEKERIRKENEEKERIRKENEEKERIEAEKRAKEKEEEEERKKDSSQPTPTAVTTTTTTTVTIVTKEVEEIKEKPMEEEVPPPRPPKPKSKPKHPVPNKPPPSSPPLKPQTTTTTATTTTTTTTEEDSQPPLRPPRPAHKVFVLPPPPPPSQQQQQQPQQQPQKSESPPPPQLPPKPTAIEAKEEEELMPKQPLPTEEQLPPPLPPKPKEAIPDTPEEEFEKIKHEGGDLLEVDSAAACANAEERRRRSRTDNATEGYLLVKVPWDSSTTMWRRRWVSYRPHARQLAWHSVKEVGHEAPEGYIDMSFVTEVSPETLYSPHGFCVSTDDEAYSFMADSDETTGKWVKLLNEGVAFMNAEKERIKTSDDKLERYLATFEKKEGELKLMIEGKRTWYKSVWCVMKGGMLFMYRDAGSREIMRKYALYHCKTEMYKGLNDTFILSTTDDETKRTQRVTLKAGSEENLHMWNNAIMKQRFLIESSIDSISIYQ